MKVVNYISEAFEELKSNVTWPAWEEVQRLQLLLLFFSCICLGNLGVDEFFAKALAGFLIG
jgi:preprotein translocase subunit SecE